VFFLDFYLYRTYQELSLLLDPLIISNNFF
jgi:hypothetical protein